MEEGEDISDYLSKFESAFQHVLLRCSESKRETAVALKAFLSVEDVKVMCLFRSLPSSMENIIDNLSTKENIKYADVYKRLLDLSSQKFANSLNQKSKAYFISKDPHLGKESKKKECNWCRKRGDRYQGHVHSDCRKLKAFKENQKKQENKALNYEKANAVNFPYASSTTTVPTNSFAYEKAFAVSSSPLNTDRKWILDSGCSQHMSSFKDQFVTMRNHKGFVTVASGMEIPVRGIGTVHIDFRTSSGKLVAATINDVLFVPELKAGNLLSESKLERNGFSIISKDGQRRVMQDGKEFIFACLDMDNQFIVQELKYKASFVSYMEAHQCFGHPGESAMQHLRQRYNKLIPHKPEQFHCPSWEVSLEPVNPSNPKDPVQSSSLPNVRSSIPSQQAISRPKTPIFTEAPGAFVETPSLSQQSSPTTPVAEELNPIAAPNAPKKPNENFILLGLPPPSKIKLEPEQSDIGEDSQPSLPRRSNRERKQASFDQDLLTKQLPKVTHQRLSSIARCTPEGKY
ncbi:Gag-pol polyprotein [Thalictrum thalictroides]|uniref:Gag-pol polyprotein n=1 Tax=Thalictrum thalictroides TaxID=46969 RepID=A0A7J6X6I0_THATH|nr:Gag-pol polyprotein [Thalictrum thalictroides]